MDYSNKKVLVLDTGLSCAHAERIARDVGEVWYWTDVFSKLKIEDYATGYGMEGVEKVMRPFKYIDKADLIYFTSEGYGDLADKLRKEGHTVFGAGEQGEELEFDRFKARQIQDKLGLPIQYTQKVKGLTKLTKYLEENGDVYVKPYIFRGTRETAHVDSPQSRKSLLRKLDARLGPMREEQVFICEDPVSGAIAECGFDILFNGKDAIKPYSFGVEKDGPYLLHFRDDLPAPLDKSLERISKLFKRINYQGAFSDEELLVSKKKSFIIDWTARWAQPLSSIYTETWKNYTEVIFKVAQGEDVTIDTVAPFAGCLPIHSEEAINDWVFIDRKDPVHFKPVDNCQTKEGFFAVKGCSQVLNLIAWGDSTESVVGQLKELAGEVRGDDLQIETSGLDRVVDDIKTMGKNGIDF